MFIVKNALKCIWRSKGRNVLIGIITLVIAISACIGLSIRQAAESSKNATLDGMSITATIGRNRQSMMDSIMGGGGMPDRDQIADLMGKSSSLSLEEYEKYSNAASVKDFYYTITAYFNGTDDFQPMSNQSTSSSESSNSQGRPGMDFMPDMFKSSGDFSLVGYSGDNAMTDFQDSISSIYEGVVFDEGTEEMVCMISKELATYNGISVGDTITVCNPEDESEIFSLQVVGIYQSTQTNNFDMDMFSGAQDPANSILMSAAALQTILDPAEDTSSTAIKGSISATYVLPNTEALETFKEEAKVLGLDDYYTIESPDINAYENSLTPLNNLSTMAGWFLVVILVIGAVILVVLNIFNVRERKYEIGVLTAMGMKKWKVAAQFMCEILVVAMVAILLGAVIGGVSAVPVTNALLESQLVSQHNQMNMVEQNMGRPTDMGGSSGMPNMPSGGMDFGGMDFGNMDFSSMDAMFNSAGNYITEVDSAMNLTVVLQMIAIGLALTLVAGATSVLFVMRYDPLKILANRD